MPVQKGQSPLLAKLGQKLKTAFDTHKADETEYGQSGELPAGIENGIAQLVDAKFDVFKTGDNIGQFYFYAAGVVVEPKQFGDIPIEGLRTSITEPLCDTPKRQSRKSLDEHVQWVLNEIRKLGVDTSKLTIERLEATLELLKRAQPYFRFRTWKGQKQTTGAYAGREPRVNNEWKGVVDYNPSTGPGDSIQEDNGVDMGTNGETTTVDNDVDQDAGVEVTTTADDGSDTGFSEFGDVAGLAEQADGGDEAAQLQLLEMAEKAGISEDTLKDTSLTWAAIGEMILAGPAADPEPQPEPEPEPPAEPKKGDPCKFIPLVMNPRTKKPEPSKKPISCEITAVDKRMKTVTLKNLVNPTVSYQKVKWDQLIWD